MSRKRCPSLVWCSSSSHCYFCMVKITPAVLPQILVPLVAFFWDGGKRSGRSTVDIFRDDRDVFFPSLMWRFDGIGDGIYLIWTQTLIPSLSKWSLDPL